jgi:hypothetical protein
VRSSVNGGNDSSKKDGRVCKSGLGGAVPAAFPPSVVVAVKALACELPHQRKLPLSRFSLPEIKQAAIQEGLVATIGETTLWRWLHEDAIRPWTHRSWIFPRAPDFEEKAGRVLDLYEGIWEGNPLTDKDFVLSADEKTSIQCRRRRHATQPPAPGQAMRLEHEYERRGAWTYLAAWDVRRAKVFGRCDQRSGIVPFERLVHAVMRREPYRSAQRVFWILDNGSSHRGQSCVERFQRQWPNTTVVHTPVHASWLNQIEIYFAIVQRKALTPNDFSLLEDVEDRLLRFQKHYERVARPFQWKFTRNDLRKLMNRLSNQDRGLAPAA